MKVQRTSILIQLHNFVNLVLVFISQLDVSASRAIYKTNIIQLLFSV